jgi:hypothetical protein
LVTHELSRSPSSIASALPQVQLTARLFCIWTGFPELFIKEMDVKQSLTTIHDGQEMYFTLHLPLVCLCWLRHKIFLLRDNLPLLLYRVRQCRFQTTKKAQNFIHHGADKKLGLLLLLRYFSGKEKWLA